MKERIARQVGDQRARHLWMGTFHSIFFAYFACGSRKYRFYFTVYHL